MSLVFSLNSKAGTTEYNDLTLALIERNIFETADVDKINSFLTEKTSIEIEMNRFDEAVKTLIRIDTLNLSSEQKTDFHWRLSMYLTLSEKFDQALNEIDKISIQNDSTKLKITLLKAFIFNEVENFESCRNVLLSDSLLKSCLTDSTLMTVEANLKNPDKAKLASTLFPGLGQFYAGKPLKGIVSLVLTAGFLTFGIYNFNEGYYVMSVLSGLFPALKFYSGGKQLAYKLSEKENASRIQKIKLIYRKTIYELERCAIK